MTTERLFDLGERVILVLFGAAFIMRFVPQLTADNPHLWVLVASEMLVVSFVVARPWNSSISTRPRDFIFALAGTSLPLFVSSQGGRPEHLTVGGLLMLAGFIFSMSGKIALNRRFGMVAANRGIQVKGPFRLVRHPIYAGYALTHSGFLIANPYWWNLMIYSTAMAIQILRIGVEEETLALDKAYRDYTRRVRFKLVPGLY